MKILKGHITLLKYLLIIIRIAQHSVRNAQPFMTARVVQNHIDGLKANAIKLIAVIV